jgi:hypothetical protein
MSTLTLPDGRIQVEGWGLAEFLREFQDLVLDGWYVDFNENDGYPVNIGGLCHAKMVKTAQEAIVDEVEVEVLLEPEKPVESVTEASEAIPAKRGRPAKS